MLNLNWETRVKHWERLKRKRKKKAQNSFSAHVLHGALALSKSLARPSLVWQLGGPALRPQRSIWGKLCPWWKEYAVEVCLLCP